MIKKVLIISHEYPPAGGGAGIVAEDLVKKLYNSNIEVVVLTNYDGRSGSKDYNIIEVKTIPKLRFISFWRRIRKLPLEEYDRIILNDTGASMVGSYFFNENLVKKTIVLLHGSEPENICISPSIWFKTIKFKKRYYNLLENCKGIIAVSIYMKQKFIELTKWGNLEEKINVIYSGVDETVFYHDPIDLYNKFNINRKFRLLLSVGRIVKDKGYNEMYNIFKNLIKEENYNWIIIGDGSYKERLKSKINLDGLQNYIHIIDRVDRQELRKYYSSVDYFWLLSNYNEALGLVYLEAQFCKTPVIGRNRAGVIEAINHGKTGYLVNNDAEVLDILKKDTDMNLKGFKNDFLIKYSFQDNTERLIEWL